MTTNINSRAITPSSPKRRGPKPKTYSTTEACAILGISTRTFRRLMSVGNDLAWLEPYKREGSTKYYRASDIETAKRSLSRKFNTLD
jgi:hypothetical protein